MKRVLSPYSKITIFLGSLCRILPACLWWPLSWVTGEILYWINRGRRRRVCMAFHALCETASITQPPAKLTRRFFHRQLMLTVAQYAILGASPARLKKLVAVEGLDRVEDALAMGNGLVVTSMHIGTYLLATAYLEQLGYQITNLRKAFMKDIASRRLREMLYIHRDAIYLGDSTGLRSPIREVIRRLMNNHVMGIAFDGDEGGREMGMPFFGRQIHVRAGALDVARLANSSIVFGLCVIRNRRYFIHYYPLCCSRSGRNREADLDLFFSESARQFEKMVREYPECVLFMRPLCQALGLEKPDADEEHQPEYAMSATAGHEPA
ncbi:MAG: hypothetical protein NTY46_14950 [Candidatus Sumerlaeota bacterium]|nr:hypothetical protein [Candidatus Sumerlaeota bacterium]